MHWQDVRGSLAEAGRYLVNIFWHPGSDGLPDPEIARNIGFTLATFVIGWVSSMSASRGRTRSRVIDEILLCQSELFARAYPARWSADKSKREAWMIEPFVARLRFLCASLNEQKSLRGKQRGRIEWYVLRVEEFAKVWVETERRYESYHQAYKLTYNGCRLAVKELGLKQMHRLHGLSSPKDELFGGAPPSAAPASPQTRPGMGWAPAE